MNALLNAWLYLCGLYVYFKQRTLYALCLFAPDVLLLIMRFGKYDDQQYYAFITEDPEMDVNMALFFYLFPHSCNEVGKYIKFIYKYHFFYKWRAPTCTVKVIHGDKQLVFNPFSKLNLETNKPIPFGLLPLKDDE